MTEMQGEGGAAPDNGDELPAGEMVRKQMVVGKRGDPWHCWHGYKQVDVLTSCANI